MALGINTNVASLNAQNALSKSQGQNDQALQRLSSGLRINSAKDDAAGLAISTRFESQISGLAVASRNANDGISLAQTAEGALDEITNNLQRVRELAVQSANATNSTSDREALNQEVQQRIQEIDRISSQTSFNGLNVLDGTLGEQAFQVGANAGETINVNLEQGSRSNQIGQLAEQELQLDAGQFNAEGVLEGDQSFDITVGSGETVRVTAEAGDDIDAILERIESAGISGITDVSVTGEQGEAFQATLAFAEASLAESVSREFTFQAGGSLQTVTVANGPGETDGIDAARMADAINEQADGITAVASDTGGNVILTAIGDTAITVGDTDDANGFTAGDISQAVGSAIVTPGALTIQANDEFTIVDGSATGLFANVDNVEGVTAELSGSLEDVDVLSVANANEAINRVDSALDAVNNVRSELGAIQNRFESTIANLASTSENLSAANSRILDADFAAETANLSQSQVLQQAGISVLAQANARPQQVLSLLQ